VAPHNYPSTQQQFAHHESSLNSFAETDIVGDEKIDGCGSLKALASGSS